MQIFFFILLFYIPLISALFSSIKQLGRVKSTELLKKRKLLFLVPFVKKKEKEALFHLTFTRKLILILTTCFFIVSLISASFSVIATLLLVFLFIGIYFLLEFLGRLFGSLYPKASLRTCSIFIFPLFYLFYPLALFFFSLSQKLLKSTPSEEIKNKILEVLTDSELTAKLAIHEKSLIRSVASFNERIAREIMVPRIDVFSLLSTTTIQEASHHFLEEGYSRIPIYKENVDQIIGVLLHKDILKTFCNPEASDPKPSDPIESLAKPVLYTPESKKISQLLQEFRSKQLHLAIVVDEYGGTEGIVTIEDILEELVGEIADEYDVEEKQMYSALTTGGWIVDARMSIIDIEKELRITIPSSTEYDTVGGYLFTCAGAIPEAGWKVHHDEFDLEVLSSNERSIEKIKILPNQ